MYKTLGSVDLLEMRRKILAARPSDYIGFNKYWASVESPDLTSLYDYHTTSDN